jgi:hypothetical protein
MQDVEADVRERMAQVARVVRRHAAHVEAHRPLADGLEWTRLAAADVEESEGHARDSRAITDALRRANRSRSHGVASPRRIRPPVCTGLAANAVVPRESQAMWEVLRWMIVFVLAVLLIVMGIYLLLGRPLPIPQF